MSQSHLLRNGTMRHQGRANALSYTIGHQSESGGIYCPTVPSAARPQDSCRPSSRCGAHSAEMGVWRGFNPFGKNQQYNGRGEELFSHRPTSTRRFDRSYARQPIRQQPRSGGVLMTVMTLKEAAAYMNYQPESFRRLAAQGLIPCRRMGSGEKARYIFVKEKLDQWLSEDLPYIDPRRVRKEG